MTCAFVQIWSNVSQRLGSKSKPTINPYNSKYKNNAGYMLVVIYENCVKPFFEKGLCSRDSLNAFNFNL